MLFVTDDLRIRSTQVLSPPAFVHQELPITDSVSARVHQARIHICEILKGNDDRLLVVVGPCSIHDVNAARHYARLLKSAIDELSRELFIVMRVYCEKPRTSVGWKGLINDPYLDQTFKINDGLRMARHLLLDVVAMGVPVGTEFLDLFTPQYFVDLVSWGSIGARTTESQIHREMASGLSCPVGFKNSTSGNIGVAIEAIRTAAHPHSFVGYTKYGQAAIFGTSGNPDCHIVLRGGGGTVNYTPECVDDICLQMERSELPPRVMIDCSHANSNKDHRNQPMVCRNVAAQIAGGENRIFGVMLESNIVAGTQKLDLSNSLVYGQSITDSCLGWDEALVLLRELSGAVRSGRKTSKMIGFPDSGKAKPFSEQRVLFRKAGS